MNDVFMTDHGSSLVTSRRARRGPAGRAAAEGAGATVAAAAPDPERVSPTGGRAGGSTVTPAPSPRAPVERAGADAGDPDAAAPREGAEPPVADVLGAVGGAVVVPRAGPFVAPPGPDGLPEVPDAFPGVELPVVEPPEVGRDGVGSVATGVAP
jgi:hypothetical protein